MAFLHAVMKHFVGFGIDLKRTFVCVPLERTKALIPFFGETFVDSTQVQKNKRPKEAFRLRSL